MAYNSFLFKFYLHFAMLKLCGGSDYQPAINVTRESSRRLDHSESVTHQCTGPHQSHLAKLHVFGEIEQQDPHYSHRSKLVLYFSV